MLNIKNFNFCFSLLSTFFATNFASFCGESTVPFSFEALPDSHPILGCARPSCFGWDLSGHALNSSDNGANAKAFFHRVQHQPDGFIRQQLASQAPNAIASELSPSEWFQSHHSNCAANFTDKSGCSVEDQWLGGIAPMADARKSPFQVRCCSYSALKHSADRGVAIVKAGQIVYGGEVLNGKRQYAFDYIANVERHVDAKGVFYEVSVRRMPCLPRTINNAKVDAVLEKEILKRLIDAEGATAEEKKHQSAGAAKDGTSVIKTSQLQAAAHNDVFTDFRRAFDAPPSPAYSEANAIEEPYGADETRVVPSPVTIRGRQNYRQPQQQYGGAAATSNRLPLNTNGGFGGQNGGTAYNGGGFQQQTSQNYYGNGNNNVQRPLSAATDGPTAYNNFGNAGSSNYFGSNNNNLGSSSSRTNYNDFGALNAAAIGTVQRPKLICDRNMTRAKRQACESYYPVQQQQQQQQQQQYYGASSGGGASSSDCCTCGCACGCCCTTSSFLCFSGDTSVQLVDGRQQRMDQLTMGDWVASANGSQLLFSMVESWIHRVPAVEAEFVRLELEDGRMLKMTAKHFIYASKCTGHTGYVPVERAHARMVYAEDVRLGDCVFAQDESRLMALFERRVLRIDTVRERGIYAPMTGTGDIVVDGILASCYSIEANNVLQKSFFNNWKTLPLIDQLYGHISEDQIEFPGWLRLLVEYVMPFVVPK